MTGTNISVCYWWVLGIEIEFNAIFIFSHTSTSQKANKIGLSLLVLFSVNLLKNISTQKSRNKVDLCIEVFPPKFEFSETPFYFHFRERLHFHDHACQQIFKTLKLVLTK